MTHRQARELHAALVGRRCDDSMNLVLGYLQSALACVKRALAGLTFPCLGGLKVCPVYVII